MEKYNVTGMSCAACSSRVEKAVSMVDGVEQVSVNLLTNSMLVEGEASTNDIIKAVEAAGYGATIKNAVSNKSVKNDELTDAITPKLKVRLWVSGILLIILMYFSMGHMMWNWPIPSVMKDNHISMGLLQMLLTIMIMVINQQFFISGFKSLWKKTPNMDTLVALGSTAAFVYSVCMLFAMTDAQINNNFDAVMKYMHELYFESAGTILTLITVGKTLEARSKGKTTDAIKGLMKLAPQTAMVIKDGKETLVGIDEVIVGDEFVVKPGEKIPVDGIIIEGSSAIDEAALTGESIPVDKASGDKVSAATINQSGFIKCKATSVGEDTTLSKIIQMVSDASATKAPVAKIADKVSGIFVPTVIIIALITIVVWLLVGASAGFALARGISVLVISCPCALGLATPVAIMVGSGVGAKNNIMFKTAVSLEETGKTQIVVLDKTGTITEGKPSVTDIVPYNISENELIQYAYIIEKYSEHPLASAIIAYVDNGVKNTNVKHDTNEHLISEIDEVRDFVALPGNGLKGIWNNQTIVGGNYSFISKYANVNEDILNKSEHLSEEGKTPLFFAKNGVFLGIIAVADVIKQDSKNAINDLKNMGMHTVMLTGDNERTANAIAKQVGVDLVVSGLLPDEKENVIRELKQNGKVIMVGDGINDAPALTCADIGIAIGAGTDIAIDAADVVLMKNEITDVVGAIRLSKATLKNIHENLFWAFIYNVIGIPLAAGVWIPLFGWQLNPMFGAFAMSLSSFCVVSNALRLNGCRLYDGAKDKKIKNSVMNLNIKIKRKEDNIMKKTMKIEGMMCGHCEASVKKALEALENVILAEVSHENGTAIVSMDKEIADDILKETVEAKDYKVISVE